MTEDFDAIEKLITEDLARRGGDASAEKSPSAGRADDSREEGASRKKNDRRDRRNRRSSSGSRDGSRSRSRRRRRGRNSRSGSRRRSSDMRDRDGRSRSRHSPTPPAERQRRELSEQRRKEAQLRAEQEDRMKREAEEARRDNLTVLVLNLSLKADERDVYEFATTNAGKVRDIQVIRDQRSGKSKGVAYVEFYTHEALVKALTLTGSMIKGQPIRMQASQAEKNRAARAAKQQAADAVTLEGSLKLYVGNLTGPLASITADELRDLFSPFGAIEAIDIHRDPYTHQSRGYAFVTFKKSAEARDAMTAMNGFEAAGQPLKVGLATEAKAAIGLAQATGGLTMASMGLDGPDTERLDDAAGGLLSGSASKVELMKKLQRDMAQGGVGTGGGLISASAVAAAAASMYRSQNLVLRNMFTPSDVNLKDEPSFFEDVEEDVKAECEQYGQVEKVWVDRSTIDGCVWVKMGDLAQAIGTAQALGGRLFGGNKIVVEFVTDEVFRAKTV